MSAENLDPVAFEALLDATSGERDVANFLKQNPQIPYWTFCTTGGHARYALNEFRLGSEHVVDMVLLNSYSNHWEVFFIEFEPVDDKVFTAKGTPTKALALAMKQCDDWSRFIRMNPDLVRRDLVRAAKTADRLGYTSRREPANYSSDYLSDMTVRLRENYKIVIGRSSKMNESARRRMGHLDERYTVEAVSYDRLLGLVRFRSGASEFSERWPA